MTQIFWRGSDVSDPKMEQATGGITKSAYAVYHNFEEGPLSDPDLPLWQQTGARAYVAKLIEEVPDPNASGILLLNVNESSMSAVSRPDRFDDEKVKDLTYMEWLTQMVRPNLIACNYGSPGFSMHDGDETHEAIRQNILSPPNKRLKKYWEVVRGTNFSGYDPYVDGGPGWKHDRQVRHARRAVQLFQDMELPEEGRIVSMCHLHTNSGDRFTPVDRDELWECAQIYLEGGCTLAWWGLLIGQYYLYRSNDADQALFWANHPVGSLGWDKEADKEQILEYLTQEAYDVLADMACREINWQRTKLRA